MISQGNNTRVARANAKGVPTMKPAVQNKIAQSSSIGLLYGEYGTGKTYLSGTVQEVVNMMEVPELELPEGWTLIQTTLFVNVEKGELGLPEQFKEIVVKNISDWAGICKTYDFMKLHHKMVESKNVQKLITAQEKYLGKKATEMQILFVFKAVIFDSLTEIQKLCINDIRGIDENTTLDEELSLMRIQDWGLALDRVSALIRYFRDFVPVIKIFIVQTTTDIDDKGKTFHRPLLQGQAKDIVLGFFDYAGFYVMKASEKGASRRLYLAPTGPFKAKNRFESFDGTYIDDPTMKDILKYKLKEDQKPQDERRFNF